MEKLLGQYINTVPSLMRELGILSAPLRDEVDLLEDPGCESTRWIYVEDGMEISFAAEDGGQFVGDFFVEAVLVVGQPTRTFPLRNGHDPELKRSTLKPYGGLDWSSNESDIIAQLGEPSSRSSEWIQYDRREDGYYVRFAINSGRLTSVWYHRPHAPW